LQIIATQKPPSHSDIYFSSGKIKPELLIDNTAKEIHERQMVEEHMPFLFNLIAHKLSKTIAKPIPSNKPKASNLQIDIDSDSGLDDDKSEDEDGEEQPQHHYERRLVSCKSRVYVVSNSLLAYQFVPCFRTNMFIPKIDPGIKDNM
jgi:hypothetical protein